MSGTKEQIALLEQYRDKLADAEERLRQFQSVEQVEARDARRAFWFGQWIMLVGTINETAMKWVREESSKQKENWLFEDALLEDDGFEVVLGGMGRRKRTE